LRTEIPTNDLQIGADQSLNLGDGLDQSSNDNSDIGDNGGAAGDGDRLGWDRYVDGLGGGEGGGDGSVRSLGHARQGDGGIGGDGRQSDGGIRG